MLGHLNQRTRRLVSVLYRQSDGNVKGKSQMVMVCKKCYQAALKLSAKMHQNTLFVLPDSMNSTEYTEQQDAYFK